MNLSFYIKFVGQNRSIITGFVHTDKMIKIFQLVLIFLLAGLSQIGCNSNSSTPNSNELALGAQAKTSVSLTLPIKKSIDLNGTSVEQLVDVRKQILATTPGLLNAPYQAWPLVFRRLNPSSPWLSLIGLQYDGLDNLCGPGESFDSIAVLNPLMLLLPQITGLSKISPDFEWNPAKLSRSQALNPDFPLSPKPSSLLWNARDHKAELSFNIGEYIERVNPFMKNQLFGRNIEFHLIGYNALDFNFRYLAYDLSDTSNISFGKSNQGVLPIRDILMSRPIVSDGPNCNGASYPQKELSGMKMIALPAKLGISLWKSKPNDTTAPADMLFEIEFN